MLKESRHHGGDDIRIDDENDQPKAAFASKEDEGASKEDEGGEDEMPPESFQESGKKKKKEGKKKSKFAKYDPLDQSI